MLNGLAWGRELLTVKSILGRSEWRLLRCVGLAGIMNELSPAESTAAKATMTEPSGPSAGNSATLFALAVRDHQAGRLFEAEKLYRQALAVDPSHVTSLHHLGI